jgi:hypothetical protein
MFQGQKVTKSHKEVMSTLILESDGCMAAVGADMIRRRQL